MYMLVKHLLPEPMFLINMINKFTYIYCCITWWLVNESFSFIFQLPNGQLLIFDYSFVQNIFVTYINIYCFWKYGNFKIILIQLINFWSQAWWKTKCGFWNVFWRIINILPLSWIHKVGHIIKFHINY